MANRRFLNLLLLHQLEDVQQRPRRIYDDRQQDPFIRLSKQAFLRLFRLSKELAMYLIEVLSPFLQQQKRANDLDVTTKVLIALRFYATGSYQNNVATDKFFCVSQSSISRSLKEVTLALNTPEVFNRFVKFPSTLHELNDIRRKYYEKYNFPGIIGIIDCTHVAIVTPPRNDEHRPEHLYVNRKGYHSINVQLICDEKLKIINVNASFPGSTHDSFIWNSSAACRVITTLYRAGHEGYYLLGDSGYPLRPWLMVPIEGNPPEDTPEFIYNHQFKSIRSSIERCNGIWKKRFRCLLKDRVLNYAPGTAGKIVNACVVLHNLCIDHNIPEVPEADLPEHPDFGQYLVEPPNNMDIVAGRINPDLVAGPRLRNRIMRNLN